MSGPEQMRQAMMTMSEVLMPVMEMANGHREQVIAMGYSPTAAEMMAQEVHRFALSYLLATLVARGKS